MGSDECKSYQLRVRVTAEERDLLEQLRVQRGRGETLSDLVREAIAVLTRPGAMDKAVALSPDIQNRVDHLAGLLKREPQQVEEACVEGILDLIEKKCDVPLIVMETQLHLKYRAREENPKVPWSTATDGVSAPVA